MNMSSVLLKSNECEASEKRIKIGVASSKAEKLRIYQLRYQVYVEEMGKAPTMSINHKTRQIVDALDDWSILLYAKVGSEIIGTVRVTIGNVEDFPYELQQIFIMEQFGKFLKIKGDRRQSFSSKLAVIPAYRCSQAAYLLMSEVYKIHRDEHLQFMFAGCNPNLVPLYERLGFCRIPQNFVDPGYGLIIPLILVTEDIEHLRSVGSPFLRIARKRFNSQEAAKWFIGEFPDVAKVINSQLITKEDLWEYVQSTMGRSPIEAIHVLNGLNEEIAMNIFHMGAIFHCTQGDYAVNQGQGAKELYILLSGRVKMISKALTTDIEPGQIFGFSSIMKPELKVINACTTTDADIMVISQQSIERFCRCHPDNGAIFLDNIRNYQ